MKRLAGILFMIMATVSLSAQPISFLSQSSFGLFTNELDASMEVGSDFLDLEDTFIFGGLTNFQQMGIESQSSRLSTITAGAHVDGEMPWSGLLSLDITNPTNLVANTSIDTFNYDTQASNGVPLPWIEEQEKTTYAGKMADTIRNSYLFVTELDGNVIGADLGIFIDNSNFDPSTNNFDRTTTYYYDASATPGTTEPDPEVDYTVHEQKSTKDNSSTVSLVVPYYIPGTDAETTYTGILDISSSDLSSTVRTSYSDTADSSFTETDILHDDTKLSAFMFDIGGMMEKKLPSLFGGDDKDFAYQVFGTIGLSFMQQSEITESLEKVYTAGSPAVDSTYNKDTIDKISTPSLKLQLFAGASHSFSYDLGNGINLKMRPSAQVGLVSYGSNLVSMLKEKVEVDTTDKNDDGEIVEGTDRIVTTTTTYTNTTILGTDKERITSLDLALEGTCALNYQPEGWKVGFTLGSNMGWYSSAYITTSKMSTWTETEVDNDAGAITTTVTKGDSGNGNSSDLVFFRRPMISNDLCINVDIAENFSMYVKFNGVELTDIGNLTIQSIIAL